MATAVAETIALKVIDLMKADSDFDAIRTFYFGSAVDVPFDHYPYAEVVVITENDVQPSTGGRRKREHLGQIWFYAHYQDLPQAVDRVVIIPSYRTVYTYLQDLKDLVSAHRTLDGLSGSTFSVIEMTLPEIIYGITPEDERLENWTNEAHVNFRVSTYETT